MSTDRKALADRLLHGDYESDNHWRNDAVRLADMVLREPQGEPYEALAERLAQAKFMQHADIVELAEEAAALLREPKPNDGEPLVRDTERCPECGGRCACLACGRVVKRPDEGSNASDEQVNAQLGVLRELCEYTRAGYGKDLRVYLDRILSKEGT